MQDPSLYSQIKSQVQQHPQPPFPEQEHLKCPRCDSPNTKFCYYNNYNLSQPRHFCKSCRRYWTKGGALRNIPVGGGSRKNAKRSATATGSSATSHQQKRPAPPPPPTTTATTTATSATTTSDAEALVTKRTNENEEVNVNESEKFYVGQFGNFGGSFSSLLGYGGGQFGNFVDGFGPNELVTDTGLGRNVGTEVGLEMESGSGNNGNNNNNGDGFLNLVHNDGWPDLAINTPSSTFQ